MGKAGILWDLSIPANLLSIPSIPLSSNCIVVKRFAMRTIVSK